jgi:hypothetical protein
MTRDSKIEIRQIHAPRLVDSILGIKDGPQENEQPDLQARYLLTQEFEGLRELIEQYAVHKNKQFYPKNTPQVRIQYADLTNIKLGIQLHYNRDFGSGDKVIILLQNLKSLGGDFYETTTQKIIVARHQVIRPEPYNFHDPIPYFPADKEIQGYAQIRHGLEPILARPQLSRYGLFRLHGRFGL